MVSEVKRQLEDGGLELEQKIRLLKDGISGQAPP